MNETAELLRDFSQTGSERAFRELVNGHVDLVYATALRKAAGDSHLAQDITQTVFCDLARKAATLPPGVVLAGWLYRHTCLKSAETIRAERRRNAREQIAAEMNLLNASDDRLWRDVAPVLDDAMENLSPDDRDALVLRYFQAKDLRNVGSALGVGEDAAQKRVSRALERLRELLVQRGVTSTASALAVVLAANTLTAAPVGLAAAVVSASLVAASAAATSVGIIQTLTLMKTKLALSAVAVAAIAAPLAYQQKTVTQLRDQNQALQQQVAQLNARAEASASGAQPVDPSEAERLPKEHTELLQLRGEVGRLRKQIVAQSNGAQQELNAAVAAAQAAETQAAQLTAEMQASALHASTVNSMKQLGLAARIYSTEHEEKFPATFEDMKNELNGLDTSRFEFVKHPRAISETEPDLILFREIQPRQLPDGTWVRSYTFVDGSVQSPNAPKGDFSDFEKVHTAKPLNAK